MNNDSEAKLRLTESTTKRQVESPTKEAFDVAITHYYERVRSSFCKSTR